MARQIDGASFLGGTVQSEEGKLKETEIRHVGVMEAGVARTLPPQSVSASASAS